VFGGHTAATLHADWASSGWRVGGCFINSTSAHSATWLSFSVFFASRPSLILTPPPPLARIVPGMARGQACIGLLVFFVISLIVSSASAARGLEQGAGAAGVGAAAAAAGGSPRRCRDGSEPRQAQVSWATLTSIAKAFPFAPRPASAAAADAATGAPARHPIQPPAPPQRRARPAAAWRRRPRTQPIRCSLWGTASLGWMTTWPRRCARKRRRPQRGCGRACGGGAQARAGRRVGGGRGRGGVGSERMDGQAGGCWKERTLTGMAPGSQQEGRGPEAAAPQRAGSGRGPGAAALPRLCLGGSQVAARARGEGWKMRKTPLWPRGQARAAIQRTPSRLPRSAATPPSQRV
jgi:hypothetical protein